MLTAGTWNIFKILPPTTTGESWKVNRIKARIQSSGSNSMLSV